MLATAAVAIAKTDLVRQPKPDMVVAEHIDALNNCDVDRLMAQYRDFALQTGNPAAHIRLGVPFAIEQVVCIDPNAYRVVKRSERR